MIIENLLWDSEQGYNLVEYVECCSLTIEFNGWHGLCPFSELIHDHDNMMMPPSQSWVMLALRVTLILQEDKPNTHQIGL
jgi:hypothetical protein